MRCTTALPYSFVMPIERDDLKLWLRQVLAHLGWTGSDLAKAMEVAPSTINRFLNDPAGFFPGDVLLVDLSERPSAGDVVCAQIYDWTRGRAETVFRIYEPPYLIAATGVARLMKPFLVDDDRVMIKGTVLQSMRPRRSKAAA